MSLKHKKHDFNNLPIQIKEQNVICSMSDFELNQTIQDYSLEAQSVNETLSMSSFASELKALNATLDTYKITNSKDDIYTSVNRKNQKPFQSIICRNEYSGCKKKVRCNPKFRHKMHEEWDSDDLNKEFLTTFRERLHTIQVENTPLSRSTNL